MRSWLACLVRAALFVALLTFDSSAFAEDAGNATFE
jgi:hypothetical protein